MLPAELLESITHRNAIAKLLSPLRRVRPRVPFFKLASHRIPTLWSLYRDLLRLAPDDNVRWRIGALFRSQRNLTSPAATIEKLRQWHKMLDAMKSANNGDTHLAKVMARYSRMLAAKRAKSRMEQLLYEDMKWRHKLASRPVLTGSWLRGTLYNSRMPRMKPQPTAIGVMIRKRVMARHKRILKMRQYGEWLNFMRHEHMFETAVGETAAGSGQDFTPPVATMNDWETPVKVMFKQMGRSFDRDRARKRRRPSAVTKEAVKCARRRVWEDKTWKAEQARRGWYSMSIVRRMRRGPPAHILAKMTDRQKHEDRAVRGLSEVGFAAKIKRKRGMRLKHVPTAWDVEEGAPENRPDLDLQYEELSRLRHEKANEKTNS